MKSPFKFLDAFTLKDKDAFFGREQEIQALYEMAFRTPAVLVYGLSGTGKTSLVQCGLASRFDGPEWFPFYIRRQGDINASLRGALSKAAGLPAEGVSLPALVGEVFEEYLSPVYLLFDQFEELFILGSPEEQAAFAADMQALLAAELPCKSFFIIREEYLGQLYPLEKAIPTLFDFRLRVEPMNNARVKEVLRSSFDKFNISLEAPAEGRLQEIIDNVSAGKSGIQLPYLQVYLDQLWKEDYSKSEGGSAKSEGPREPDSDFRFPTFYPAEERRQADSAFPALEFTQQEIQDFGRIEEVLDRFLEQQREELQEKLEKQYPGFPGQGVRQVLDAFVTAEGTKRPVGFHREEGSGLIILEENIQKLLSSTFQAPSAEASAKEEPSAETPPGRSLPTALPRQDEPSAVNRQPSAEAAPNEYTNARIHEYTISALTTCLESLEHRRLLRFEDEQVELAHDSLAALIDQQRTDEQRQLNEIRQRIAAAYREWQRTGEEVFLTRRQLLSFEELLPKVQLEPHLQEFVAASYAFNQAREEAEHQRQQEELEKERRLREEAQLAQEQAEAHARQARRRTRVAGGISILAIALAVIAFFSFRDAQSAKILAEQKKNEAEKATAMAKEEESKADAARQEALDSAMVAREQRQMALEGVKKAQAAQERQRRAQLEAALADARQRAGEQQYDAAIQSYQNALALALPVEAPPIRSELEKRRDEQREYQFSTLREKGLRLVEAGECNAARRYLEEASVIRPEDEALNAALEKCR